VEDWKEGQKEEGEAGKRNEEKTEGPIMLLMLRNVIKKEGPIRLLEMLRSSLDHFCAARNEILAISVTSETPLELWYFHVYRIYRNYEKKMESKEKETKERKGKGGGGGDIQIISNLQLV
jgi:hypothetical protein